MKEKIDPRIVRTQQQLKETLLHLAVDKPLARITVKELTDQAGLNRGTFYLHYQDMNDFYEQLKTETLDEYHKIIKKLQRPFSAHEPFTEPPIGFVQPFAYVRENQRFFKIFMGAHTKDDFAQQMTELLNQQFQYVYLLQHPDTTPDEIPVKQKYLFSYLASAYVGSLQFWIQQNFDLSPNEMAILFSEISQLGSGNLHFSEKRS